MTCRFDGAEKMSGDLISRDALIDEFNAIMSDKSNGLIDRLFIAGAICMIQTAPAVDAEPVRHGIWGECEITGYDGLHPVYTRPCSECGNRNEYLQIYCPNCGAKMDGGDFDAEGMDD